MMRRNTALIRFNHRVLANFYIPCPCNDHVPDCYAFNGFRTQHTLCFDCYAFNGFRAQHTLCISPQSSDAAHVLTLLPTLLPCSVVFGHRGQEKAQPPSTVPLTPQSSLPSTLSPRMSMISVSTNNGLQDKSVRVSTASTSRAQQSKSVRASSSSSSTRVRIIN